LLTLTKLGTAGRNRTIIHTLEECCPIHWTTAVNLAGALGIEPKLTESKSVVLPLHNAPTIKNRIAFLAFFQEKIFNVCCCYPKLERVARIELANQLWQSCKLPLHHTRINLAPRLGFEPRMLILEIKVLPITLSRHYLAVPRGNDPLLQAWQACVRPWTLWDLNW
jgi:hypothetical protein